MRISLLLCLFLTVTVSVLASNPSDPFNQKRSDRPKEIKTDMVEPGVKSNKISSILKGANIASALMLHQVGEHLIKYTMEQTDGNPYIESSIIALVCISGILVNLISVTIPHEEDKATISPQRDKSVNIGLFVANALFATLNVFFAGGLLFFDSSKPLAAFSAFQGVVNTGNCVLRRSWFKDIIWVKRSKIKAPSK